MYYTIAVIQRCTYPSRTHHTQTYVRNRHNAICFPNFASSANTMYELLCCLFVWLVLCRVPPSFTFLFAARLSSPFVYEFVFIIIIWSWAWWCYSWSEHLLQLNITHPGPIVASTFHVLCTDDFVLIFVSFCGSDRGKNPEMPARRYRISQRATKLC